MNYSRQSEALAVKRDFSTIAFNAAHLSLHLDPLNLVVGRSVADVVSSRIDYWNDKQEEVPRV